MGNLNFFEHLPKRFTAGTPKLPILALKAGRRRHSFQYKLRVSHWLVVKEKNLQLFSSPFCRKGVSSSHFHNRIRILRDFFGIQTATMASNNLVFSIIWIALLWFIAWPVAMACAFFWIILQVSLSKRDYPFKLLWITKSKRSSNYHQSLLQNYYL